MPLTNGGEGVRKPREVRRARIVVAGRRDKRYRTNQRTARLDSSLCRVVNRKELLAIFGDAASAVNDVASNENEIGVRERGLVSDCSLGRGALGTVTKKHKPVRLRGGFARAAVRFEYRLIGLQQAVAKLFSGHKAGQARAINKVRWDARRFNLLRPWAVGGAPSGVPGSSQLDVPGCFGVRSMPEQQQALGTRELGRVTQLQVWPCEEVFGRRRSLCRNQGGKEEERDNTHEFEHHSFSPTLFSV